MASHLFSAAFSWVSHSSDQRACVFQAVYIQIIITAPRKDSAVSSYHMPYKMQKGEAGV